MIDPLCTCGEPASAHLNGTGPCLKLQGKPGEVAALCACNEFTPAVSPAFDFNLLDDLPEFD